MLNDFQANYYFTQVIKNLRANGIKDITKEDCTLTRTENGKSIKIVFRFFTEEGWLSEPKFKATTAQIVMNKAYKGCILPDYQVSYGSGVNKEVYFIKMK